MKRWLLLLAACGTPAKKPPDVPAAPAGSAPAPQASPSGPVVKAGGRNGRIEAPHGGAITLLAASTDGKTVVTVDELGGTRLWTALDGSAEPRVVDLARPVDLAVGAHPRGHVIATMDSVGALAVQIVDPDGLTLQRAALPIEPAYGGVASASAKGVLAWRVDQRVVLVSPETGAITAELPTEPGQRILAVGANADRAIAVIESGTTRKARWLTLSPRLAWGAFVDGADDLGANITLSPSGKRIASVTNTQRGQFAIVLDASGTLVAYEPAPSAIGIALPTDDHAAIAVQNGLSWIDLPKAKPKAPSRPAPPAPLQPALGDTPLVAITAAGRAVGAINGELMIASPTRTEFLGYELESPAVASAAPDGNLLIGLGDTFALLDHVLAARPAPDLQVPSGSSIADLEWLAGSAWLVQSSRLNDGITSVALVDTATSKSAIVRKNMAMVHMMTHHVSTGLVAFSLGDTPELLRHVPGKLELKSVAQLPKPKGFERAELVPVNPALANNTHVVVVHMRDRLSLRWAKDPQKLEAARPLVVDGSLASVDAAGRVYVWQSDASGALVLVMYRDGKSLGQMPTEGPTALWPDPKGTRVLQVGQRSVSLVGVDAVRVWAQPLQGVNEAIWLDDNTVAIISAAGIARLDAATGNVLAARCGWRFGLSTKQHPISPRVEPVCTQLPRPT